VADESLATLSTEATDPALTELDRLATADVVRAVVGGHDEVLDAVRAVEADIARLADAAAERMDRGGRVIYAGAGAGGRVALLDAAEWGPTFGVPDWAVVALVAGAEYPPGSAEEAAAEDDAAAGAAAVRSLAPAPEAAVTDDVQAAASGAQTALGEGVQTPDSKGHAVGDGVRAAATGTQAAVSEGVQTAHAADPRGAGPVGPLDAVIGVSASGRTPYVLGAIEAATAAGALTAAVTSHPGSRLAQIVDIAIEVPVGPEVISGSTRLKAGTAQKLVLNAFSTAVMVCRGRTLGNLMVGMRVANDKLRERAVRVCMLATGCTEPQAGAALAAAHDDLAVAVVSLGRSVDAEDARRRLEATGGAVRAALEAP
jgi:N-acetylmuramic acid 6-phosphate etherase